MIKNIVIAVIVLLLLISGGWYVASIPTVTESPEQNSGTFPDTDQIVPRNITVEGYWECLPHKDTTGPQTLECAFGIKTERGDGHYAIDTRLMSTYPIDSPTGAKVRVTGILTPVEMLSSIQRYDIDGIISATSIEKI